MRRTETGEITTKTVGTHRGTDLQLSPSIVRVKLLGCFFVKSGRPCRFPIRNMGLVLNETRVHEPLARHRVCLDGKLATRPSDCILVDGREIRSLSLGLPASVTLNIVHVCCI